MLLYNFKPECDENSYEIKNKTSRPFKNYFYFFDNHRQVFLIFFFISDALESSKTLINPKSLIVKKKKNRPVES